MTTARTRTLVLVIVAALIAVAVVVATSGGDSGTARASGTDRAFTASMTPHHKSAVAMARIAKERSRRPEILALADDIITAQDAEISQMRSIDGRLAAAGAPKGKLEGASMMGMGDEASLKTAKPFDRAFIDMMIPHHQGAIQMARSELATGSDAETKKLASAIITAQTSEIEKMNRYRKAWFGSTSPAGGVPAEK